jgi:hypothetical protein
MLLVCSWLGAACGSGDIGSGSTGDGTPGGFGNAGDNGNDGNASSVIGDRGDATGSGVGTNNGNAASSGNGSNATGTSATEGGGASRSSSGGGGGSSVRSLTREDLVDAGPLRQLTDAANDPRIFTQPRAGVTLKDGSLAFIGLDERISADERLQVGARSAVFLQRRDGARPVLEFNGAGLTTPLDIDVSIDEKTLFVADFAGGRSGLGAIVLVPVNGGAISFAAEGYLPRSVTVALDGAVLFSGIDPATAQPGVFELQGSSATPRFLGAPLLDPSGIAAFADGRLLVADTGAFDAGNGPVLTSQGSIVLIDGNQASVFAGGFATGFPAGIALTLDESTLLVSGEGQDRSDTLFLVDVANAAAPPRAVTASFSAFKDASAGLKRAHDEDTFIWASLAANGGGTVFRIED